MDRERRQELRTIAEDVAQWIEKAKSILTLRSKTEEGALESLHGFQQSIVGIVDARVDSGRVAWRVLPLIASDGYRLGSIARQSHVPPLSSIELAWLNDLTSSSAAAAVHDVKSIVGARRFFSGSERKGTGLIAAEFLTRYQTSGRAAGLPELLGRLLRGTAGGPADLPVQDALQDWVGLRSKIAGRTTSHEVIPVSVLGPLADSIATIDEALLREQYFRTQARGAAEDVHGSEVRRILTEMPVDRLREASRDRIRTSTLTDAGITTIQAVLDRGRRLEHLPGIGATTASRMLGAAQTLRQTTYDEIPTRIDTTRRTPEVGELLRRLGAWDMIRQTKGATMDLVHKDALTPLVKTLGTGVTHLAILAENRPVEQFRDAVALVNRRASTVSGHAAGRAIGGTWEDFLARSADYYALLSELGFITEDENKTHGDLPDDIVEAVRRLTLNTQYLTATLRGYQSFAARFALTQRKVIIGDEMGLGKTIEAIAVLAHLYAAGCRRTLVICPAAVVTNWVREIESKSTIQPHRVHGPDRESALDSWRRGGGIAVTTFETLAPVNIGATDDIGCIVVDEAQYIKNPAAQRSKRVSRLIETIDRAILLTGTPMENRIEEFGHLVRYLSPNLVDEIALAPLQFRRQVAPAYLRRNQEDVLTELPGLVEVNEWLPMSATDKRTYRDAVYAGNFMAMRRAAMANGNQSEKMQRLIEIVKEAGDNGRRVIVFSYFRDVLDDVARTLPGQVFGPLTGSVPAAARQTMVDQFSAAGGGAVLVSQILAGGVGLNIQAASVVVICEPQLKPTTEWQAIGRSRRMGQLQSVQVHRLLSEKAVDQRISEILARKKVLFDNYARPSATADSAPEAFDMTEADLAREVIQAEQLRLLAQSDTEPDEEPTGVPPHSVSM